jgi:Ser-tRNA(Ala) deacylase AlaX
VSFPNCPNEESLGTSVDTTVRVAFERLHGAELIVSAHLRNRTSQRIKIIGVLKTIHGTWRPPNMPK